MSDIWMKRLDRLATRQEARFGGRRRDLEQVKRQAAAVVDRISRAEEVLEKDESEFREHLGELIGMRDDPTVLVRDYGSYQKAYHSEERPCGWVGDLWRYKTLLLGEALSQGLRPCSACGYRAQRRSA